jgi:hypothetical protein
MPFSKLDEPTKALLVRALDSAWLMLGHERDWTASRTADETARLTRQLLAAADAGERDHDKLVRAALNGINRN